MILTCPKSKYDADMRIRCTVADDLCAHQRYKPCKGWCVLTEQAEQCPARKDENSKIGRKTR